MARKVLSYWLFPLISATLWFSTLTAMLITWGVEGRPHYISMEKSQTIAYISDIGADILKPLFIVGSVITGTGFFLALLSERWLRHRGRLHVNLQNREKFLSWLAILGAAIGTAGIILLSIFDTKRHMTLHRCFLLVWVVGVILSAVCTVIEYNRLEITHKREDNSGLKASYYAKLTFLVVEVALAVAFGVTMYEKVSNVAAVLEWVVAYVFTGYLLIFVYDLMPATRTHTGELKHDLEMTSDGAAIYGTGVPGQQNF